MGRSTKRGRVMRKLVIRTTIMEGMEFQRIYLLTKSLDEIKFENIKIMIQCPTEISQELHFIRTLLRHTMRNGQHMLREAIIYSTLKEDLNLQNPADLSQVKPAGEQRLPGVPSSFYKITGINIVFTRSHGIGLDSEDKAYFPSSRSRCWRFLNLQ